MDFETRPSEWALGNLIVGFDNGTNLAVPTTKGFNTGVDRLTVGRATLTIGDLQRFPIYVKAGRDVLPIGISTGVHRIELVQINDLPAADAFDTLYIASGK